MEEEIFSFLHKAFHLSPKELKTEFEVLLQKLKNIESDKSALRAFAYLDIISWLESKISNIPVQEVIQKKYRERKKSSRHVVSE